jgi:hypothetical protein
MCVCVFEGVCVVCVCVECDLKVMKTRPLCFEEVVPDVECMCVYVSVNVRVECDLELVYVCVCVCMCVYVCVCVCVCVRGL